MTTRTELEQTVLEALCGAGPEIDVATLEPTVNFRAFRRRTAA